MECLKCYPTKPIATAFWPFFVTANLVFKLIFTFRFLCDD